MELIFVKLLVMTLSGVLRVFFGMFPLVVVKTLMKTWSKATDKKIKKIISVLMFFGGGVLLATCFLHMMPEVRESFAQADPDMELPLSEIIFLAGFFLVYLIEDIVHSIIHNKKEHDKEERNIAEEQRQIGNAIHNRSFLRNSMRKGDLSCGTLTNGDKGLHNNEVDDRSGGEVITTATTPNAVDVNNASVSGIVNANRICSTNNKFKLSLSVPTDGNDEQDNCNTNPNPQLRETKEIFRQSSLMDEIPALAKSGVQDGNGGITNGGFVSEKFQYNDPDWWKDIVKANSQINLISGSNSTATSCTTVSNNSSSIQDLHRRTNLHSTDKDNNNSHNELQIPNNPTPHSTHSPKLRFNPHSHHSHLPMDADADALNESIGGEIRNLLIVIAISFHGIFEGMAIGLQNSELDVWYLFLAVSLHECTILFCIGVELISSKTKVFRMVLYILVVALVSPVGIAIGIIVSEKSFGDQIHRALIVGCFQGLAAGTLLYVTFFEIFQEEGRKLHRKCYHILVAVLGFVLMGSLEFMGGHSHGRHNNGEASQNNNSSSLNEHSHEGHSNHNHNNHDHHH